MEQSEIIFVQSFSVTFGTMQFQLPLSVFELQFSKLLVSMVTDFCFTCRSSWQWVLEPACPDWKQHHWDQVGVPSLLSSSSPSFYLLFSFSSLPLLPSLSFSLPSHIQHNSHSNRKRPSTWIWICWHANSCQEGARLVDIMMAPNYFLAVFYPYPFCSLGRRLGVKLVLFLLCVFVCVILNIIIQLRDKHIHMWTFRIEFHSRDDLWPWEKCPPALHMERVIIPVYTETTAGVYPQIPGAIPTCEHKAR